MCFRSSRFRSDVSYFWETGHSRIQGQRIASPSNVSLVGWVGDFPWAWFGLCSADLFALSGPATPLRAPVICLLVSTRAAGETVPRRLLFFYYRVVDTLIHTSIVTFVMFDYGATMFGVLSGMISVQYNKLPGQLSPTTCSE